MIMLNIMFKKIKKSWWVGGGCGCQPTFCAFLSHSDHQQCLVGRLFQSAKNSLYLYLHFCICVRFSLYFLSNSYHQHSLFGRLIIFSPNPFVLVFVLLLSLLGEFCCFFYLSSFHCLYFSVPKNSVVSWICICVCVCDDIVIGCEKNTPCV